MEVIRDELQQNNTDETVNTNPSIVSNTDRILNTDDIIEEEDISNTIGTDNNNVLNGNNVVMEESDTTIYNNISPSESLTQLHNIFENQYFL